MRSYRYTYILVGVMTLSLGVSACSSKKKEELQVEVKRVTADIGATFEQAARITAEVDADFEKAFTATPLETLPIEGMDRSEGGEYDWFEETTYYKPNPKREDVCIEVSFGVRPVDDETKRRMKRVSPLCPNLIKAQHSSQYVGVLGFFATTYNHFLLYPFFDAISTLPSGFDYEPLFWVQMALAEQNPDRNVVWFPEPHVTIGPEGWVYSMSSPVYDEDSIEGVIAGNVLIYKMGRELLKENPYMLLLMSADTLLVGSTASANQNLNIKAIEDYDYLEQLAENPKVSEEFKLSHEEQSADLQKLAQEVKANTEFTTTIHGKEYFVTVGKVADVELYVVGLLER